MSPDPLKALERSRLLAIVRVGNVDDEIGEALVDAGVTVAEVSLAADGALETIARWRSLFPKLELGAGTVLDVAGATAAIDAGASFLISPGAEEAVAECAAAADVPHIPGAATPTEIRSCLRGGASLVKLFPAAPLGTAYLQQLLGPMPDLKLVPTGGVDAANAGEFLAAGAVALAVGSSLVNSKSTYRSVSEAAEQLLRTIASIDKRRTP